jgi:hypothetical protein
MAYREHRLKVLPQYYEAWKSGVKCFELRKDDRDYQVGDFVWLCEWDGEKFTGRSFSIIRIDYILRDCPEYGLMDGYCILGFARPPITTEPKHGRWIPCSERLPDKFGKTLVTFISAAGALWTRVIIANYSDLMGIAKPCFWIGNVGKNDFENINSQVVAWMPLPEPYQSTTGQLNKEGESR